MLSLTEYIQIIIFTCGMLVSISSSLGVFFINSEINKIHFAGLFDMLAMPLIVIALIFNIPYLFKIKMMVSVLIYQISSLVNSTNTANFIKKKSAI